MIERERQVREGERVRDLGEERSNERMEKTWLE